MPQIRSEASACMMTLDGLLSLHANTAGVAVRHRKLISEIAVLRMFYALENAIKGISCRVACGALYGDGAAPVLLAKCKTVADAEHQMKHTGRSKPRHNLSWTTAKEIKENLRYLLDPKDHLMHTIDSHGSFIDEVRRVRNRIAHNNLGVRSNFRVVVKRHYGAELNNITPGTLLLSPRKTPPLIETYLAKSKLLVKILAKV